MSFFSPEAVKARSEAAKKALGAAAAAKKVTKRSMSIAPKRQLASVHEEQEPYINSVVAMVADQNFADATNLVNDLLNQRVVVALDEYKQFIAQNIFSPSVELSEETEDKDKEDKKDEEDEDEKDEEDDEDEKDEEEDKKK